MKEGLASDSFRVRMRLSAFLNIVVVNEIGEKENGRFFFGGLETQPMELEVGRIRASARLNAQIYSLKCPHTPPSIILSLECLQPQLFDPKKPASVRNAVSVPTRFKIVLHRTQTQKYGQEALLPWIVCHLSLHQLK
jgi:hypothetical protein